MQICAHLGCVCVYMHACACVHALTFCFLKMRINMLSQYGGRGVVPLGCGSSGPWPEDVGLGWGRARGIMLVGHVGNWELISAQVE